MMNLYEMMQSAQNGQAMQNIARQYGLSQQQTQAAMDALLPAFSMGLQRQTQDPYAFGNLAQMMTATPFAKMFEAPGNAIPANAQTMGNDVLSQLFGSKEVSNAVAAQAAATSGVGQAILKQMLPVIASMVMGGLFKSASSQGMGGMFGQIGEMMRGQPPGQASAQPSPNPTNPLEAILGGLFGNGQNPGAGQTQGGGPFGGGQMPGGQMGMDQMGGMLGQILTGMLGGGQQAEPQSAPQPRSAPRQAQPQDEPDDTPPSDETGPGSIGLDALNQMFEHGRQVQDSHQDALKSIFEGMFGGQNRR